MQKGSAQLLLILAAGIIIVGSIFYYVSNKLVYYQSTKANLQQGSKISPINESQVKQSKSAENNSLEYLKPDLGFKFKFSKNLKVLEDSEEEFNKRGNGNFRKNFKDYVGYEPGEFLGAVVVLDETKSYSSNPFSLWVFNNQDNLTVEKWFDKYWYYPFLWGVFDYTSKGHITPDTEATISGQLAIEKTVSYQNSSPKYLYVSKNQKMYLFRIIGETGDKILSTFIFIPKQ